MLSDQAKWIFWAKWGNFDINYYLNTLYYLIIFLPFQCTFPYFSPDFCSDSFVVEFSWYWFSFDSKYAYEAHKKYTPIGIKNE